MEKERTEAEGNSLVDLETARLVLTPVTEEHIDPICAHFTKEVVTYMVPGPAKERGDMEAVVRRFMEQRRAGTDFVYAITLKGSSEFIGVASLHHVPAPVPELGIWTKMEAHGHHYGREAIGAMLRLAASMGIGRLCYPVDRRNVPSRKIPLYYGGRRTDAFRLVRTPDGRTLEEERYEIETGSWPPSCVEQRRAAGLFYGKVERFYSFFRVKKIPAIAPIRTIGANRTNSHSNI